MNIADYSDPFSYFDDFSIYDASDRIYENDVTPFMNEFSIYSESDKSTENNPSSSPIEDNTYDEQQPLEEFSLNRAAEFQKNIKKLLNREDISHAKITAAKIRYTMEIDDQNVIFDRVFKKTNQKSEVLSALRDTLKDVHIDYKKIILKSKTNIAFSFNLFLHLEKDKCKWFHLSDDLEKNRTYIDFSKRPFVKSYNLKELEKEINHDFELYKLFDNDFEIIQNGEFV